MPNDEKDYWGMRRKVSRLQMEKRLLVQRLAEAQRDRKEAALWRQRFLNMVAVFAAWPRELH